MPNMKSPIKPGLFGQDHNNSSRDYTNPDYWGKNQFNSSFPASLVAYMSSKGLKPVYLTADGKGGIKHASISGRELFLIDPLAGNAYYNFEAGFPTYEKYYTGEREKIDLVMVNSDNGQPLIGLEVKLTALPDRTNQGQDRGQIRMRNSRQVADHLLSGMFDMQKLRRRGRAQQA